jgi:hypothetical protein
VTPTGETPGERPGFVLTLNDPQQGELKGF